MRIGVIMPRVRKIYRSPDSQTKNYYIIDACFLANRFIPPGFAPNVNDRIRINNCLAWWNEIDAQLQRNKARIYIPDVCIAEAFKVLAKKYYSEEWFSRYVDFNSAKKKMAKFIETPAKLLKTFNRRIKCHDISTCRDIIISVDRFFELFMKHKKNVQICDLILAATAKYLTDFYDIPRESLHIITLDKGLYGGIQKTVELQNAYDPTLESNSVTRIFTD